MLLEGKVAIVSGIGPGMGRDISLTFARHGADLAIAARTPEKLDALAAEIEALGRKVIAVPTDITNDDQCQRLASETRKAFGRIDVLVNNAFHQGALKTFEDAEVEKWRRPFEVNVIGTLQLTKAVVPTMKEQRNGSIVMINSQVMREVLPTMGDYAASKGALLVASQTLARELGPYGIRVNSVVPGYIMGPALEIYFQWQGKERGIEPAAVREEIEEKLALGRIPNSEEISGAVLFFASDLSRVVTGQSLDVNGGQVFR